MGLDLVEILLGWEEAFGISIPDSQAAAMLTPRMATDVIAAKLGAVDEPRGRCSTLRAFNRLRQALISEAGVARERVRLDARLTDLLPECNRQKVWRSVRNAAGMAFLPEMRYSAGEWFKPKTVRRLFEEITPRQLKTPGEPWTRAEVRAVVRAVIKQQTNLGNFSDDDYFVRDLKLG